MHDVHALVDQQAPQRAHLQQVGRVLASDRQGDVLAALRFELCHQAPTGGDHQRAVTGGDQGACYLQGAAFHATALERGQQLQYGQAIGHRCSIASAQRAASSRGGCLVSWRSRAQCSKGVISPSAIR